MKRTILFSLALVLVIATLFTITVVADYTTRNFSESLGSGVLPGTCTIGDSLYASDTLITYTCTAANVWTATGVPAAYGELYEGDAASVIDITTAGDYYQWTTAIVGSYSLTTPSAATDNITIDATGAGLYVVNYNVSFEGTVNTVYHWHVFVNNNIAVNIGSMRKIGASSDVGSTSASGLVALAAGDIVDLRVTSNSDTTSVTISHVDLDMSRR